MFPAPHSRFFSWAISAGNPFSWIILSTRKLDLPPESWSNL
jgi:hypothetical protein